MVGYQTKPLQRRTVPHECNLLFAKGRKTITGFRKVTHERRDLSCMTRFLAEAPWNHRRINQCRLQFLRQMIVAERETQAPESKMTFLIVDDTNSVRRSSIKRMEQLGNLVVYVYQQALNHMPLYEVLAELKLTA